jgi:hypothetical protein
MTNKLIFLIIFIVLVIFGFGLIIMNQRNNVNAFLTTKCLKGKRYKNGLQKCTSLTGYTYVENVSSKNIDSKIDRKTLKCVMDQDVKTKLLTLSNIFVPSIFNGTYCDILYTTYYDDVNLSFLKNRIENMNLPMAKCVRIRRYHFNPNIYFEIKHPGGTKLRALIDPEYNLLEPDIIDSEYKESIITLLEKIKSKQMLPLFENTYKRLSFIYKRNPDIRMTIDTNIEYVHKNIYGKNDKDVLEMKLPETIDISEAKQYIREINHLANTNLKFEVFSKFDYYYNMVMNS